MIYLDLDGPLVNWTQGVLDLFEQRLEIKQGQSVDEALGISKSKMWKEIKKEGAKWWSELYPQPWAQSFYDELSSLDEVVILTSPGLLPEASSGKVHWLQRFFGKDFTQFIITKRKDLLAKPGDILIDDSDKNCTAFTQAGGIGIVFPMPWNKASKDSSNPVEKVLDELSQIYPNYSPPIEEAPY